MSPAPRGWMGPRRSCRSLLGDRDLTGAKDLSMPSKRFITDAITRCSRPWFSVKTSAPKCCWCQAWNQGMIGREVRNGQNRTKRRGLKRPHNKNIDNWEMTGGQTYHMLPVQFSHAKLPQWFWGFGFGFCDDSYRYIFLWLLFGQNFPHDKKKSGIPQRNCPGNPLNITVSVFELRCSLHVFDLPTHPRSHHRPGLNWFFFILHSAKCLQHPPAIPSNCQVQTFGRALQRGYACNEFIHTLRVANAVFRYSNRTVDNVWTLLGFVGYFPVQGWVTQLKQFATWVLTCSLETSSNYGWIPFPCFMPLPFLLFGIDDITFEHLKRTCPNSQFFLRFPTLTLDMILNIYIHRVKNASQLQHV